MGGALPLLNFLGSGIAAVRSIQRGEASDQVAQSEAMLLDNKATQSEQDARSDERDVKREQRRRMGALNVRRGTSGIQQTGSADDVLNDIESSYIKKRKRVLNDGMLNARRFRTQADIRRFQGKAAKSDARLGAGASLLTGVGSFF